MATIFDIIQAKSYGELLSFCNEQNLTMKNSNGQTALTLSIQLTDSTSVDLLLASGANPNFMDKNGLPLKKAIEIRFKIVERQLQGDLQENLKIIKSLLKKGADVNSKGGNEEYLLFSAIEKKDEELMQLLIDSGADVLINNKDNETILIFLLSKRLSSVKSWLSILLKRGLDINKVGSNGRIPLLVAIEKEYGKEIISDLLNKGAQVNVQDNQGKTPLLVAIEKEYEELIKLLLNRGVDIVDINCNIVNYIIKNQRSRIFYIFLAFGKISPIMMAKIILENRNDEYLDNFQKILQKYKNFDEQDENGQTLLHILSKNFMHKHFFPDPYCGSYQKNEKFVFANIFTLVLEKTTNINIQDKMGMTPLHIASDNACLKTLLSHKANPNIQDKMGMTPLHIAPDNACLKTLLSHKANPNIQDNQGRTPLHYMALNSKLEEVRILISYGGNFHIPDKTGITAYQIADMLANMRLLSYQNLGQICFNEVEDDDD